MKRHLRTTCFLDILYIQNFYIHTIYMYILYVLVGKSMIIIIDNNASILLIYSENTTNDEEISIYMEISKRDPGLFFSYYYTKRKCIRHVMSFLKK